MKKYIAILTTLLLLVSSFLPLTSHANTNTYEDLIISEYIEGSSYNKAIELYNGTGSPIDLSGYTLELYSNGSSVVSSKKTLTGTLENGGVLVLAHGSADEAILAVADIVHSVINHNGNDAYVLKNKGTIIDSIGQVGTDPGKYWGSSSNKTADMTLVRNVEVTSGDTNIYDSYDPSVEWTALNKDTFDYLGIYPDDIVIEEPKSEYVSTVERVVDGDTIELSTPVMGVDKVRYLNIDTAETYHINGDYDLALINSDPDHSQKYHGELAKEYLNSLLKPGDEVIVKVGEEAVDQYGRLLAQIIRKSDGLNTNLEMVRAGHAVTYFIYPTGDKATYLEFQAAVKEAMDNKLGIWNEQSPVMELPFEFRARDMEKGYSKFVGNSDTMQYVQPNDYGTVPVEKRVFFLEEMEAIMAGYTPGFDREPIIADARYAPLDSTVTVEGIVTYIKGANYYISDYSGGIIVRTYVLGDEVTIGDTIRATGETSEWGGMLQVNNPSEVNVISTGGTPKPYAISGSEIGERTEGQFISLEDVKILELTNKKYQEYKAVDPSGAYFTIDIGADQTLEIGVTYEKIIGVISSYKGNYEVVTRSTEDIIKEIPVSSIAEARAAELNTRVNVEGIVTAAFYAGGKTNYFVQDETGAIVVRVKGLQAEIGDKIRAKARTEEYFGMLQIQPYIENVEIVEAGVGVPEPKLITSADIGEELEGQLVEIRYATIESKSEYNDYYGSDMLGEFTLDSDEQYLDVNTTYESIIGVIDYNYGKYKITPRSYSDATVLHFFSAYASGEEDLLAATNRIIEANDYLTTAKLEEFLLNHLNETVTYKNADKHIPVTVQHIMTSLEKLNNGHHEVEVKKIEHELEKIFKKNTKRN